MKQGPNANLSEGRPCLGRSILTPGIKCDNLMMMMMVVVVVVVVMVTMMMTVMMMMMMMMVLVTMVLNRASRN